MDEIVDRLMMIGVYRIPEHMGVRFRDVMFVRNVLAREEAPYVEHPAEEEIYKQLDGRLLVLRGPKGDGLSVAALAALTRKILLDRAVVIDAKVTRDSINVGLADLVNSIREAHREPILYLDLSNALAGLHAQARKRQTAVYKQHLHQLP